MESSRAKFKCNSVTKYGQSEEANLSPVTGGAGENSYFNKYTPSGELKMHICNPGAFGFFEPDKEYYLDFTPAEEGKD